MGDEISRRQDIHELLADMDYRAEFQPLNSLEQRAYRLLKEEIE